MFIWLFEYITCYLIFNRYNNFCFCCLQVRVIILICGVPEVGERYKNNTIIHTDPFFFLSFFLPFHNLASFNWFFIIIDFKVTTSVVNCNDCHLMNGMGTFLSIAAISHPNQSWLTIILINWLLVGVKSYILIRLHPFNNYSFLYDEIVSCTVGMNLCHKSTNTCYFVMSWQVVRVGEAPWWNDIILKLLVEK